MAALDSQQSLSSQGSASLATSSSYATSSRSPADDDASSLSSSSEASEESKEPEPYQLPHDRAVAAMPDEDDEDEDDGSYSRGTSESSGESIVPDLGGDEDDDPSAKMAGAGLLGYLGLGQETKPPKDDYAYDFEGEPEPEPDESYDFGDDEEPELDEEELLAEEGLKDDRLEARLALAYDVATAGTSDRPDAMKAPEFRKAVAMMGRVFSKEETDRFFDEALAFSEDKATLGISSERDERGLLKRNVVEPNPQRNALALPKDDFVAYFSKFVTRTVDPREAAEHFRALVEGAAEQALRDPDDQGVNDELRAMADTKHRRIDELFIYARDLRKVVASMSERLTDEEADAFIRECKPAPLAGAADGGLERVYFHQYLNMLKDDS